MKWISYERTNQSTQQDKLSIQIYNISNFFSIKIQLKFKSSLQTQRNNNFLELSLVSRRKNEKQKRLLMTFDSFGNEFWKLYEDTDLYDVML